ncbi:hypothetical protein CJ030_MR2G013125 [Morella rubra]|uniref:Uncharacterized protein n=1 Tax=Morella rubra TaxID=262757 RepID=A0A6A1W866_9ROSI|nr:hypothetical protein CJ030_MR2G013125 [Morella rubra]
MVEIDVTVQTYCGASGRDVTFIQRNVCFHITRCQENIVRMLLMDQTFLKVVEQASWVLFLQRTGYVSVDMMREFYAIIRRVADVSKPGWEVIVRNTRDMFSLDELARFFGYERPMAASLNLLLSEEGRPYKFKVMHLILSYCIDPKKLKTELSFHQAE